MKWLRQDARRQLERFLSTLFLPDELIELRFIESWVSCGKKHNRVVRAAEWLRCEEFVSQHGKIPAGTVKSPTDIPVREILATNAEAMVLVQQLGKPSRDRSRRDFAVACELLRLGLSKEEIWPLVWGRSKFESNGRPYFDLTIANAERRMLVDQPRVG